ncbi:fibronectin type III domain-containing protein [Silvibacterium acidisoli]|uniref:fibronectin type III domain-containing protein n=1 Tax=Acidobacteriaceae bacterium ZG23-2 TaxID=2883246 RepID=UPI00406C4EE0
MDTTPPTSPTGLTVAPAQATAATLSWNASTDSGSGVVAYDIYQNGVKIVSTGAGGALPAPINNIVEWGILGLTAGTSYTFDVVARDAAGNASTPSASVNLATPAGGNSLSAPSSVTATQVNYTDVQLAWSAASAPTGISKYVIFANEVPVMSVEGNVTSADVVGLSPGTTYNFTIEARNDVDTEGIVNSAAITTKSYPAGGAVSNVSGQITGSNIVFTATFLAPYGFHHIYLDADSNSATGYDFTWTSPAMGADYLIENTELSVYSGTGTDFTWTPLMEVDPVITGNASTGLTYTWTVPLSAFSQTGSAFKPQFMGHGGGYAPEAYSPVLTPLQ